MSAHDHFRSHEPLRTSKLVVVGM